MTGEVGRTAFRRFVAAVLRVLKRVGLEREKQQGEVVKGLRLPFEGRARGKERSHDAETWARAAWCAA
jgi:hypothetical protein